MRELDVATGGELPAVALLVVSAVVLTALLSLCAQKSSVTDEKQWMRQSTTGTTDTRSSPSGYRYSPGGGVVPYVQLPPGIPGPPPFTLPCEHPQPTYGLPPEPEPGTASSAHVSGTGQLTL